MSAGTGSAAEWLRHARSDLALAQATTAAVTEYETRCFLAQQAAEKAIKAVLVHHGLSYRHTHNLALLLDQADAAGIARPPELDDIARLTDYAVHNRYPYVGPRVDDPMYREALQLASDAVDWAMNVIWPPTAKP